MPVSERRKVTSTDAVSVSRTATGDWPVPLTVDSWSLYSAVRSSGHWFGAGALVAACPTNEPPGPVHDRYCAGQVPDSHVARSFISAATRQTQIRCV